MFHTSVSTVCSEASNDWAAVPEAEGVCVGLWFDVTGICSGAADSICTFGEGACCSVVFVFLFAVAEFICVLELSARTCSAPGEDCGFSSCSSVC